MYPMHIICSKLLSVLKLRSSGLAEWVFKVPKVMFLQLQENQKLERKKLIILLQVLGIAFLIIKMNPYILSQLPSFLILTRPSTDSWFELFYNSLSIFVRQWKISVEDLKFLMMQMVVTDYQSHLMMLRLL
jgi:hypothetical protein